MPGTQTLVNLVSILCAFEQDFLFHKSIFLKIIFTANVWRCPVHLHGRDSPGKVNSRLPRIKCTWLITKAILCKSQWISFLPEDENVCRVYAGTAGLPLANRQFPFLDIPFSKFFLLILFIFIFMVTSVILISMFVFLFVY